jgi:hypothetical protein
LRKLKAADNSPQNDRQRESSDANGNRLPVDRIAVGQRKPKAIKEMLCAYSGASQVFHRHIAGIAAPSIFGSIFCFYPVLLGTAANGAKFDTANAIALVK